MLKIFAIPFVFLMELLDLLMWVVIPQRLWDWLWLDVTALSGAGHDVGWLAEFTDTTNRILFVLFIMVLVGGAWGVAVVPW